MIYLLNKNLIYNKIKNVNRYASILTEIQTNQSHGYNKENKIED